MQPLSDQVYLIPNHQPPPPHHAQRLFTRPQSHETQPDSRKTKAPDHVTRLFARTDVQRLARRERQGTRYRNGNEPQRKNRQYEAARRDTCVRVQVSLANHGVESARGARLAIRKYHARCEARVQEAQRPVLDEVHDVRLRGAEVGVQRHEEVQLDEHGEEEGDGEDEGCPDICEASGAEAHARCCGCGGGEGCDRGGSRAVQVANDVVGVVEGVCDAAERVDAEAEGVDVVHFDGCR